MTAAGCWYNILMLRIWCNLWLQLFNSPTCWAVSQATQATLFGLAKNLGTYKPTGSQFGPDCRSIFISYGCHVSWRGYLLTEILGFSSFDPVCKFCTHVDQHLKTTNTLFLFLVQYPFCNTFLYVHALEMLNWQK